MNLICTDLYRHDFKVDDNDLVMAEHTPMTNNYVTKRSYSQNVSKRNFNPNMLQRYDTRTSLRRHINSRDLIKYAKHIEAARTCSWKMCMGKFFLYPSQLVTYHNVLGAAVHKSRRDFGVRPSSVALSRGGQNLQEGRCKTDSFTVQVFDCLVARGAFEYSAYTEHTDLSEKIDGSLVRLQKEAFQRFFVLLIHIMSKEVLIDQLIVIDRRQVLVQLLCNWPLRAEFAALILDSEVITRKVMCCTFVFVIRKLRMTGN